MLFRRSFRQNVGGNIERELLDFLQEIGDYRKANSIIENWDSWKSVTNPLYDEQIKQYERELSLYEKEMEGYKIRLEWEGAGPTIGGDGYYAAHGLLRSSGPPPSPRKPSRILNYPSEEWKNYVSRMSLN